MNIFMYVIESDNINGFSLGGIYVKDSASTGANLNVDHGRRYMVFVELVSMFDQLRDCAVDNKAGTYTLPNGDAFCFDPKTKTINARLGEEKARWSADDAMEKLRSLLRESAASLTRADCSDPVLEDITAAISS